MRALLLLVVAACGGGSTYRPHPTPLAPAPLDPEADAELAARLVGRWAPRFVTRADGVEEALKGFGYKLGRSGDLQITFDADHSVMVCVTRRDGRNLAVKCSAPRPFSPNDPIVVEYKLRIERVGQHELALFDYASSETMRFVRE